MQRSLLVRYHVDDPVDFFQSSGFWKVPNDPTVSEAVQAPQPPYYLQVKTAGPGDLGIPADQCADRFPAGVHERLRLRVVRPGRTTASSPCSDYPPPRRRRVRRRCRQLFRTTQEVSEPGHAVAPSRAAPG